MSPDAQNPTFVVTHSDLSGGNVLIDENTLKITGVIDWEWCCASPPGEEIANATSEFDNTYTTDSAIVTSEFLKELKAHNIKPQDEHLSFVQRVVGNAIRASCYRDWAANPKEAEELVEEALNEFDACFEISRQNYL
ncbi:hypothetical protein Pelo_14621 [Pelomyxa schiedti]|nr:hypothetical protein Pelo_14621 [Pelomyxa schiedti]